MSKIASPIRVLLADDHMAIREVVRVLFKQREHLELVGEVDSCQDVIDCAALQQPDIIVLALMLSDGNSLYCLPQLRAVAPGAKIIIFSGREDAELLHRAVANGALGWVRKTSPTEILLRAIECVYAGEVWLERSLLARVLEELIRNPPAPQTKPFISPTVPSAPVPSLVLSLEDTARITILTTREREIIGLIGQGLKNKQIAASLFLSEKTVHSHLSSIFQKLEVSDRLQLAVFAHRTGLLSVPVSSES